MKKMIIRADDVGYTKIHNLGTWEAIDHGMVTAADVMLESPGTEDALEYLKQRPWISLGWHTHFWCSPVLPVAQVKSLVIPGTNRFRHDIQNADDINEDELYLEMQAQICRCVLIAGRAPDTTNIGQKETVFNRVQKRVCDEYGIAYQFARKEGRGAVDKPLDKWAHLNIFVPSPVKAYGALETDSISAQFENYDPVKYYTEDPDHLLDLPDDCIVEQSWHPGYVDFFVYKEGEQSPRAKLFTAIRTQDVAALTSPVLRDWVKAHGIELVNFRDALYGTREYQNHLRCTGSELYIGTIEGR